MQESRQMKNSKQLDLAAITQALEEYRNDSEIRQNAASVKAFCELKKQTKSARLG